MKIQVKGRHVAVTEPLRDYAEEKLAKLHRVLSERHIDEVTRVELELIVEKGHTSADSQVAEATVFTRGPVMRARESSPDMYASIDLVTEKLQRQAKKYHDKVHHKALRHTAAKAVPPASLEPPTAAEPRADGGVAAAEAVVLAAEPQTAPRPVAVAAELGAPPAATTTTSRAWSRASSSPSSPCRSTKRPCSSS